MITLTARINLNWETVGTFDGVSTNLSKNNISSEIRAIKGVKEQTENAFIFGASKLGEGSTLSDGVNYFISDILSGEDGKFDLLNAPSITISGNNLSAFTIVFDTINNRYPKELIVNGKYHYPTSPYFTYVATSGNSSYSIEITKWSEPNCPIIITGAHADFSINVDRNNLVSLQGEIIDRGDIKTPSYGIISNKGILEFNDFTGEFKNYIKGKLLKSGIGCSIILKNTLTKSTKAIKCFSTENCDYDEDGRIISISLSDGLIEWQQINFDGVKYSFSFGGNATSCSHIYNTLLNFTNKMTQHKVAQIYSLDEETQNILENTYVRYFFLKSGSIWEQWNKLCEICQLHMYKNNDNYVICKYNGGN